MADVRKFRDLFQQLKIILGKENDEEALHITNQLEVGLRIIDATLNNPSEDQDLKQLIGELERLYIKINQPRIGLSDYFIWRDDYDERLKENERLDIIKDNLLLLFRKY